jgi:hypothetical protein
LKNEVIQRTRAAKHLLETAQSPSVRVFDSPQTCLDMARPEDSIVGHKQQCKLPENGSESGDIVM